MSLYDELPDYLQQEVDQRCECEGICIADDTAVENIINEVMHDRCLDEDEDDFDVELDDEFDDEDSLDPWPCCEDCEGDCDDPDCPNKEVRRLRRFRRRGLIILVTSSFKASYLTMARPHFKGIYYINFSEVGNPQES